MTITPASARCSRCHTRPQPNLQMKHRPPDSPESSPMSFPSFAHHPVIPQTPDQARQRDQQHAHQPPTRENPVLELARLRNAVRRHRQAITTITDPTPAAQALDRAAAADHALWAHLA